jgi:hypothetical protein
VCTAEDIATCNVLNCSQSNYKCDGTTLYQDYVCDPKQGKCNYMQAYANNSTCAARTLGSATVYINNQKIDPTTAQLNPFTLYQNDRASLLVVATDTKGMALPGATVTIQNNLSDWGGFANPADLSDHSMNCSSTSGLTGTNGKASGLWLWTAYGETNLFGSNTHIVTLTVSVTYQGTTLKQYIYIALPNNNFFAGMTNDGVLYGSVCCGAATAYGCPGQSTITMIPG